MSAVVTLGRRPTLGEVLGYYTRSDFLQFLLATCRVRPVVMIISKTRHWAPRWEEDIVQAQDEHSLREYIVRRIHTELSEFGERDRPDFYPSFHQLIGKWPESHKIEITGRKKPPRMREMDCVFEADLLTWQESFGDVLPVLELMDECGVCYQHKFSGHRSLHVTLPGSAIPSKYGGKGANKILQGMRAWYGSQAHYLGQINRMPYSLNEDSGLVCLPIRRGGLEAFRPWQAILHCVEIDNVRQGELDDEDCRRAGEAFLEALFTLASKGKRPEGKTLSAWRHGEPVPRHQYRLPDLESGPRKTAWQLLTRDHAMTEEMLQAGLARPDVDTQWLTVEAFLLHGEGLSRESCLHLMSQEEEYVRAAAMDVLLRFEDDLYACALGLLGDLGSYPYATLALSCLMARSDPFRKRVLDAFSRQADCPRDARPVIACAMGAVAGNWDSAFRLLEPMRAVTDLDDRERALLRAVELMSSFGGWDRELGWDPKEEARKQRALAALGPGIVDLLLLAAVSPNEPFRMGVVAALALMGDARAANVLISYLGYDDSSVRSKAISGLVRIGDPAVETLLVAAASDEPLVRRSALFCLGRIGSPRARPALLEALDDTDPKVRRQAFRTLKEVVTADDVERLVRALREETWDNALLAAEAIGRTGKAGRQALLDMALEERNPPAAYAIAAQGDPRGRDVLVRWLSTQEAQRDDAVEYLRELGDQRCIPYLLKRLKQTGGKQGMAIAESLGQIEGEPATAALLEALASRDKLTRRGAARALGERQDPTLIGPLIECIAQEDDPKVRNLVSHALQGIGEAAKEPLMRALEEHIFSGKAQRNVAKRVLWSMGVRI
jgi:HEAT repeat protein